MISCQAWRRREEEVEVGRIYRVLGVAQGWRGG